MIVHVAEKDDLCSRIYELYNQTVNNLEVLHQELLWEEWKNKFFAEEQDIRKYTVADADGHGFASGCIDDRSGKCFITFIAVEKEERRKGLGGMLLEALEKKLREEKGQQQAIEISFFNPVVFGWNIPEKDGVTHPNTPGVDVSCGAYLFFKNCGYREFALQNSYYLPLSQYEYPADMEKHKENLKEKGFTFTVYDNKEHSGMKEMLQALGNPEWQRSVLGEPALSEGGRPILVALCGKQVCGFTGPLAVEESGRGFFAGIAVDEKARGNGLAKTLFCALCYQLKEMGAEYMTLFTGENNPARNIYEAAGFSVVRSWSDMRKER